MNRAGLLVALVAASIILACPRRASADPPDPVAGALGEELARSMTELALPGMPKPYFIAYRFVDRRTTSAVATFGGLERESKSRSRLLTVEVRVGDYGLDNSNFSSGFDFASGFPERLPLENDAAVIRHAAWAATDRAYKAALDQLEKKKAQRNTQSANAAEAGSFSQEAPVVGEVVPPLPPLDGDAFPALARKLSAVFRDFATIQSDRVEVSAFSSVSLLLTSEGTRVEAARAGARVEVSCTSQADDGMKLRHALDVRARNAQELPGETALVADVRRIANELDSARAAPTLTDDVEGPVLFEGLAAPSIFRELLGQDLGGTPGLESDTPKFPRDSPPKLEGKLGQRILPEGFRVEDDPTLEVLGKTPLVGGYKFDDEGVPAQKVLLVDDGVLKTLLMSRAPIKEIAHSNGHAVMGMGNKAFGGISNLLVKTPNGLGQAELKKRLVAEIRKSGVSHGYIVRAFASSSSFDPEDFVVSAKSGPRPLLLIEVDRDGKERQVRGGSFPSLEIRLLKEIVATGKDPVIRNGDISGRGTWSHVAWFGFRDHGSLVVPSLLFKEMEIKKMTGPEPKTPVTKQPFFAGKTP